MLVYLVNLFWPSWPSILPNSKTHYLTTRGSQCFRFQHLSTTTQVAWVNKCWWFCFIDPPLYKYIFKKNYKSNISVYLLIWLNIFPMATLFKKKTAGKRGSGKASLQEEKAKGQAAYVSGSTSPLLACWKTWHSRHFLLPELAAHLSRWSFLVGPCYFHLKCGKLYGARLTSVAMHTFPSVCCKEPWL